MKTTQNEAIHSSVCSKSESGELVKFIEKSYLWGHWGCWCILIWPELPSLSDSWFIRICNKCWVFLEYFWSIFFHWGQVLIIKNLRWTIDLTFQGVFVIACLYTCSRLETQLENVQIDNPVPGRHTRRTQGKWGQHYQTYETFTQSAKMNILVFK